MQGCVADGGGGGGVKERGWIDAEGIGGEGLRGGCLWVDNRTTRLWVPTQTGVLPPSLNGDR